MFSRTQLAASIAVVVFATVMLLTLLYKLVGDIVAYGAAAALLSGLLIWFIDYASERWMKPKV